MVNIDNYIHKVKEFNQRKDYQKDVSTAKLFLEYCLTIKKLKNIYFIGTGLGGDSNN